MSHRKHKNFIQITLHTLCSFSTTSFDLRSCKIISRTLVSFSCTSFLDLTTCLFSPLLQNPSAVLPFAWTSDIIFAFDGKCFNLMSAWRLTTCPRTMAWSFTNPFSARKAFLACFNPIENPNQAVRHVFLAEPIVWQISGFIIRLHNLLNPHSAKTFWA